MSKNHISFCKSFSWSLPMQSLNDFLFFSQLSFYFFQLFNLNKSSTSLKCFYPFGSELFSTLWPQDISNYTNTFVFCILRLTELITFIFKFRPWILNSDLQHWISKPGAWPHHASGHPIHMPLEFHEMSAQWGLENTACSQTKGLGGDLGSQCFIMALNFTS